MANHVHGVLVAATVTNIQLDDDFARVQILNADGAAEIWVSVDSEPNPAVNGDCARLPAAMSLLELDATEEGATLVKLYSTGTPKFSVWGVRG